MTFSSSTNCETHYISKGHVLHKQLLHYTAVFRLVVTKKNQRMLRKPIQIVDFEWVYHACAKNFVTTNLKTAVV